MKIVHISDIHIRNNKFHEEQSQVFERMYSLLREIKPDIIVNTGDTAHTKLQLSPAYFHMAAKMFESLADIAPYHIILGNHDLNLKNPDKIDAITPIVAALKHPNLHFHKYTGTFDVEDFRFHVLSILEDEEWLSPEDSSKTNIALYHGAVCGVKTDKGFVLENGDKTLSDFKKFDYALLGDIHKSNQILDLAGRIRYAGSLCQNNFGETDDKGFLLWDIQDKTNFKVKQYIIPNPKPFVTVELTEDGKIPDSFQVKDGARLRIVSNTSLSLDVIRKSLDIAKQRFKPESVTYLKNAGSVRSQEDKNILSLDKDLRSIEVQESLIKDYLKDFSTDEETIGKVLSINKKFNSQAEQDEEVIRNIDWSLKEFKWSNLFNYGGSNFIDFTKLNGVVGIFAKNYSGKSSIIDSLTYTLFNGTSKNKTKNYNMINQNKSDANGELKILVGEDEYVIRRESSKYLKKLKGHETEEAKTDLSFTVVDSSGQESSLNGETRADTDKNITKYFGSLEDFLLTSMASQNGSFNFISEGSTKRKEILAKFMDLEIFDKKYKLAKDASSNLKGALNRMEKIDFSQEIVAAEADFLKASNEIAEQKKNCDLYKKELDAIGKEVVKIGVELSAVPTAYNIDIEQINKEIQKLEKSIEMKISNNKELVTGMSQEQEKLNEVMDFLSSWNINEIKSKKIVYEKKRAELNSLLLSIADVKNTTENKKNKLKLLEEVPCGDNFPTCKFLQDAYAAKNSLQQELDSLSEKNVQKSKIEDEIDEIGVNELDKVIGEYEVLEAEKQKLDKRVTSSKLMLEKNKSSLSSDNSRLKNLQARKKEYFDNESLILESKKLIEAKKQKEEKMLSLERSLEDCEKRLSTLYKSEGSYEQRVLSLEEQKSELEDLRKEYSAYDLYLQCMHNNGISYEIIKNRLPIINEEVAKITANIVDFEIFFENDGKKLDILIKHPGHDPRPLEMGSGAEKTIAAMAIRLAMIKISNMPCGDIFILDEPATSLDEENMEGFMRIIDMIKTQFKTVILISHLDSLKDCADMTIDISTKRGFAYVNQ